jgi:serine/threonine protein phosphatase PrpC
MLVREFQKGTDIHSALHKTITQLDRNFMKSSSSDAGSTAIICLHDGFGAVHCANVGDSRAVLCRSGGVAQDLSVDQKATRRDEVVRINQAGGYIARGRALGSLAVSRALGDGDMKRQVPGAVIADPELQTVPLRETDEFILCACDGVWDVMSSQDAIDFVRMRLRGKATGKGIGQGRARSKRKNPRSEHDGGSEMNDKLSEICEALVHECINVRRSTDNVSVLLVCFQSAEQEKQQQELRQQQQQQEQQEQLELRKNYRNEATAMRDKVVKKGTPGWEQEGRENGSKAVGRGMARRTGRTAKNEEAAKQNDSSSRRKQKQKPSVGSSDTGVMTFQQRRRRQQRLQLAGNSSASDGGGGLTLSPSLSANDASAPAQATGPSSARGKNLKWWEKPIKGKGKSSVVAAGAGAPAALTTVRKTGSASASTRARPLVALTSPKEARRRSMVESYKTRLRENLGIGGTSTEEVGGAWEGAAEIGESERVEDEQQQQRKGRGRGQPPPRWRRNRQQQGEAGTGAGASGARRLVAQTPASGATSGGSASASSLQGLKPMESRFTLGRRLSRRLPNISIAGK